MLKILNHTIAASLMLCVIIDRVIYVEVNIHCYGIWTRSLLQQFRYV